MVCVAGRVLRVLVVFGREEREEEGGGESRGKRKKGRERGKKDTAAEFTATVASKRCGFCPGYVTDFGVGTRK